ncbi:MAG: hypothetical protein AAF191_08510 [Verrucomicrobiota bacterium]
MKPNKPSELDTAPLPTGSTERIAHFVRPLRKPIGLLMIWLLMEATVGHPCVCLVWVGYGGGRESMTSCRLLSITGEQREHLGYKDILCFLEKPERSLRGWIWNSIPGNGHE